MGQPFWSVREVIEATGAKLVAGPADALFESIGTDTRSLENRSLFVALSGANFDGHDFVAEAVRKGSTGVLVSTEKSGRVQSNTAAVLAVDDTLFALGELARFRLEKLAAPVLAVTGSSGKTTTKEMIGEVIDAHFSGDVLKTEGNFNNLIGLPLTVFNLTDRHKAAVLEMGMNMRGEIRRLARIARPTIGVITNVSAVHIEHLKNIGAVAEAKGELLEDFGAAQTAVLNADDERVSAMAAGRPFRAITFGIEKKADVTARDVQPKGFEGIDFELDVAGSKAQVRLSCIGRHNVYNALAAAAAGHAFGVSIEKIVEGLEAFHPAAMRSRILDIFGIKVIDDTYNANPSSMDAALSMLLDLGKRGGTIAVLGDMFELGDESEAAHRRLGRHAARMNLEKLYLIGQRAGLVKEGALEEMMPDSKIEIFEGHRQIVMRLRDQAKKGDVILVKGSRGMRMEIIVKGLKGEPV